MPYLFVIVEKRNKLNLKTRQIRDDKVDTMWEYIITVNEMDCISKCSIKIILYFITWKRVVIEKKIHQI